MTESTTIVEADAEPKRVCGRCGRTAAATPEATLTWMREKSPRGTLWICTSCTRANIPAIEANLDVSYWV